MVGNQVVCGKVSNRVWRIVERAGLHARANAAVNHDVLIDLITNARCPGPLLQFDINRCVGYFSERRITQDDASEKVGAGGRTSLLLFCFVGIAHTAKQGELFVQVKIRVDECRPAFAVQRVAASRNTRVLHRREGKPDTERNHVIFRALFIVIIETGNEVIVAVIRRSNAQLLTELFGGDERCNSDHRVGRVFNVGIEGQLIVQESRCRDEGIAILELMLDSHRCIEQLYFRGIFGIV